MIIGAHSIVYSKSRLGIYQPRHVRPRPMAVGKKRPRRARARPAPRRRKARR